MGVGWIEAAIGESVVLYSERDWGGDSGRTSAVVHDGCIRSAGFGNVL